MTVVAQQQHRGVVMGRPAGVPDQILAQGFQGVVRGLHAVTSRFLTPEEGGDIMAGSARLHPRAARRLRAFTGFPADSGEEAFREAGRSIPFVRLDGAPPSRP